MDWDDLRYFLALAREGTLSRAGNTLGVKHTTVARRVRTFEASLETRLFDHVPDGYRMTQAGENIYEHALIMEEQALTVQRQIAGLDTRLRGQLTLTGSYDVLNHLVVPYLDNFMKTYPGINLEIQSSPTLADLTARQADIALRMTESPPEYLVGRKIMPLVHGIYATEEYLEKQQDSSFPPHRLILWNYEKKLPDWASKHFPNALVSLRTDEVTTMQTSAVQHLGLVRLPCYIGDNTPELVRLDLPLKPSRWGVWVLHHIDLRTTARVRACKEFLIRTVELQSDLIGGKSSRYTRQNLQFR